MTPSSWIFELRERLASPPPATLTTEGARRASLVPIFVDGGELWLLLQGPAGHELVPAAATLAESPVEAGEEPWVAAERSASRMGLDPATLLRLGHLDQVPEPSGDVVIPCVAAVPAPPTSSALVRLPLRAARTPSLLEERRVAVRGVEVWITVAYFGPVKVAGVEPEIVELLLERLFQG